MHSLLKRLELWLLEHRPEYAQQLNPGLDDERLGACDNDFQHVLLPDFRLLYQWHDGQGLDCFEAFYAGYRWLPLGGAIARAQEMNDMVDAGHFEQPGWWDKAWLPFLDDGGCNHLCIDARGAFGGTPGQVIYFDHEDDERTIVAPNITSWLGAFVTCLEAGMWDGGADDWLDGFDDDQIFAKHIPGYPINRHATDANMPA